MNASLRPSLIDYALLIALLVFSAAPVLIQNDVFSSQLVFLHKIFPHGYFLAALGIIVLKTILHTKLFEFSLSLSRWTTLIGLFLALRWNVGALSFISIGMSVGPSALTTASRPTDDPSENAPVLLFDIFIFAPLLLIAFVLLYSVVAIFWGIPIGPKHNRIFPDSGGTL